MKKNATTAISVILFLIAIIASKLAYPQSRSPMQKLKIITNAENAIVDVDIYQAGKGQIVETSIDKTAQSHKIKVTRNGYKTEYVTIMAYRSGGKFIYPSEVTVECKTPFLKRTDDQKYIHLFKTAFDVKKEDLLIRKIKYDFYRDSTEYAERKRKFDKSNKKNELQQHENLSIENSIFTSKVNKILADMNFIDTVSDVFQDYSNTLYVQANVKTLACNHITYYNSIYTPTIFIEMEAKIEWEILDYYKQSRFTGTIESKSGGVSPSSIYFAIEDLLTNSFLQLFNQKEVQDLMRKEPLVAELSPLDILSPKKLIQNIKEAKAATVTIIRSDGGHGSGLVISNDGYILTNYHVLAGKTDLEILQDDVKLKAKIVRVNSVADLAVLKVDTVFDFAFQLPSGKNFAIGDDVFAIGTPQSLELGQSISKGIISSFRKTKMGEMIQTDASVNSGNSGGPLVNNDGNLVGIVNAKLLDVGIEGIGFSIPGYKVMEYLNLKYK